MYSKILIQILSEEKELDILQINFCRNYISWFDDNLSSIVSYLVVTEHHTRYTQYLCLPRSIVFKFNHNYYLSAYQRVKSTVYIFTDCSIASSSLKRMQHATFIHFTFLGFRIRPICSCNDRNCTWLYISVSCRFLRQ